MNQEHTNLLSLSEYCTLISKKTNMPYLDKENNVYIFDTLIDANEFIKTAADTTVSDKEILKPSFFITYMYGLGAENVCVKKGDKEDFITIPVDKADTKKDFFNPSANRNLLRLLQTGDKKYLRNLKEDIFLCPVKIDKRQAKKYSSIHYACAKLKDDKKFYLLFTTLDEFNKWNEAQGKNCLPLEVNMIKESQIRRNNPVIINPLSNKVILNDRYLKLILKKE